MASEKKPPHTQQDNESFENRLNAARNRNGLGEKEPQTAEEKESNSGLGRAMQLGVELFSAIAVGTGIGYWLDKTLETTPIFIIVFFFLGCGAGFLNLYRFVKNLGYDIGYKSYKKNSDK